MSWSNYDKMDLDCLQEKVFGGMSKYQVLVCMGAAFLAFSTGPAIHAGIFFSATPEFQCAAPQLEELPFKLTREEIKNFTTPMKNSETYDSCVRYDQNLTACEIRKDLSCLLVTTDTVPCGGYWYEHDVYTETPMSQFNIVCDRKIKDAVMNTFLFVGYFLGSIVHGPISDRFGRKLTLILYWKVSLILSVGLALVNSYEFFALVRCLGGVAVIGCYVASYVYAME